MSEEYIFGYYKTPLGLMELKATGHGLLVAATFKNKSVEENISNSGVFEQIITQLDEYFNGMLKEFSLPLAPKGTVFQQKVWNELLLIPFGQTITYLQLARRLGDERSIRAAAAANGKNPLAILIPCHRVIGANGKLTGYAGGLDKKQWLLHHEARICGYPTLF
jgi:methylated-DNA-[protein]-cysteine S-methyltransferase